MQTLPSQAHAQKKNISGVEKAIIAYYRLSNKTPNFDNWARLNLNLSRFKKSDITLLEQEKLRLQYGFGTYEPDKEILMINTKVYGQIIQSDGKHFLATRFPNEKTMTAPYFPYNAGGIDVAVILNNLKDFLFIELNDDSLRQAQMMLSNKDQTYELSMTIHYRPSDAENNAIILDRQKQYLMLGEIAYLNINKAALGGQDGNSVVWEYYAPWHLNDSEQELLDILNEK